MALRPLATQAISTILPSTRLTPSRHLNRTYHISRHLPSFSSIRSSPTTSTSVSASAASASAPSPPTSPFSSSSSSSSPSSLIESQLTWPARTHKCGELRNSHTSLPSITICGWVDRHRDLGGLLFLDIRDHTGIVQVVVDPASQPDIQAKAERLRSEWVVAISGKVRPRSDPNPNLPTGTIEIVPNTISIVNSVTKSLPFSISSSSDTQKKKKQQQEDSSGGGGGDGVLGGVREEIRLRNRVLDLRRAKMSNNLRLRHALTRCVRRFLEDDHDFIEIETPILTRSTPEGARDFLVPSRVQAGSWYALPQSPQLFKQMLMVAGMDRYYQIARCFRDEDLRADRQPEFTQLDMEVSWMDQEALMSLVESMVRRIFIEVANTPLPGGGDDGENAPFRRITYEEAMEKYASDKPDLRYGLEMATVTAAVAGCSFRVFADAAATEGCIIKGMRVPDGGKISNSRLKPPKGDICAEAQAAGAPGLVFGRVKPDGSGLDAAKPVVEGLTEEQQRAVIAQLEGQPGDLLLFAAGPTSTVNKALDRVRGYLAKEVLHLITDDGQGEHSLVWVTDFPMFEWNEEEGRLEALHHPFTAPRQEDLEPGKNLKDAKALAYDLVWNGVEIGGGSLRIYRRDIQEKVFEAIGLSEEEAQGKFGYLLDSFEVGAPPHGGIAFGMDRFAMLLAGAQSIRDVIAFPKTTAAQCSLTGAPAAVDEGQLSALHVASLAVKEDEEGEGGEK